MRHRPAGLGLAAGPLRVPCFGPSLAIVLGPVAPVVRVQHLDRSRLPALGVPEAVVQRRPRVWLSVQWSLKPTGLSQRVHRP